MVNHALCAWSTFNYSKYNFRQRNNSVSNQSESSVFRTCGMKFTKTIRMKYRNKSVIRRNCFLVNNNQPHQGQCEYSTNISYYFHRRALVNKLFNSISSSEYFFFNSEALGKIRTSAPRKCALLRLKKDLMRRLSLFRSTTLDKTFLGTIKPKRG